MPGMTTVATSAKPGKAELAARWRVDVGTMPRRSTSRQMGSDAPSAPVTAQSRSSM
jgi:hypothetical protein